MCKERERGSRKPFGCERKRERGSREPFGVFYVKRGSREPPRVVNTSLYTPGYTSQGGLYTLYTRVCLPGWVIPVIHPGYASQGRLFCLIPGYAFQEGLFPVLYPGMLPRRVYSLFYTRVCLPVKCIPCFIPGYASLGVVFPVLYRVCLPMCLSDSEG